jgi:hypothetical protein
MGKAHLPSHTSSMHWGFLHFEKGRLPEKLGEIWGIKMSSKKHPLRLRRNVIRSPKLKDLEPQNKESFEHALWEILITKAGTLREAAQLLKSREKLANTVVLLSAILKGKKQLLQEYLLAHQWKKKLRDKCPGWAANEQKFEKYALTLPKKTRNLNNSSPALKDLEPQNKESFEHTLWEILITKAKTLQEAAQLLKPQGNFRSTVDILSVLLKGKKPVFQEYVRTHQWREKLRDNCPGWAANEQKFEKYALALPKKPRNSRNSSHALKDLEPRNKESFEYTLWKILISKAKTLREAAQLVKSQEGLDNTASRLRALFKGKERISQKHLLTHQWREKLRDNCPGWAANEQDFEKYALTLPRFSYSISEPVDKDSAGYLVWCILTAQSPHLKKAAKRLRYSHGALYKFIHSKEPLTAKKVLKKGWIPTFQKYYKKGWQEHGLALLIKLGIDPTPFLSPAERRVIRKKAAQQKAAAKATAKAAKKKARQTKAKAKETAGQAAKLKKDQIRAAKQITKRMHEVVILFYRGGETLEALRKAAGEFAKRIRQSKGDDIADLTPDMNFSLPLAPGQTKDDCLKKAEDHNKDLPLPMLKDVVSEVCRIYSIDDSIRGDPRYQVAQMLMQAFPKSRLGS